MTWISSLKRWWNSTPDPDMGFREILAGGKSHSGVRVTAKSVMTFAPVWQAVNVLAGDLSQLPLVLYRRVGDTNKERALLHPAYSLIKRRPNPYMNVGTFKETLMYHALLWGNGYAEIARDNHARPIGLTILLPDRTSIEVDGAQVWYVTKVNGIPRKIRPENVLHIKGLGFDGLQGHSVISLARNSFGLGLASEKYANKFYANDARPAGVLQHPKSLNEEAVKRMRKDWKDIHEGLDNVGRIAILEEGLTFSPISMSMRDAQWVQARQASRIDVASWFNIPPHKLGDLEKATFSNVEEQNRNYLNTSLMRWLVTWQEECYEKLLTEDEKRNDSHLFEFVTAALLRGDLKTRFESYAIGISNRFLNPNEVRGFENWPAYEGGDSFLNPNITPEPDALDDEPITDRLRQIINVEIQRVRTASKHASNFPGWVASFYERWPNTLREVLAELHADETLADDHADRSRAELLAAAPDQIASILDRWSIRADELAALIIPLRKVATT